MAGQFIHTHKRAVRTLTDEVCRRSCLFDEAEDLTRRQLALPVHRPNQHLPDRQDPQLQDLGQLFEAVERARNRRVLVDDALVRLASREVHRLLVQRLATGSQVAVACDGAFVDERLVRRPAGLQEAGEGTAVVYGPGGLDRALEEVHVGDEADIAVVGEEVRDAEVLRENGRQLAWEGKAYGGRLA